MDQKEHFYIGTYTEPILFGTGELLQGKGEGIYCVELDCDRKELFVTGIVHGVKNPSFLTVTKDGAYVAAVNELKEYHGENGGSVSLFRTLDEHDKLEICDRKSTHGQDPCHVTVSENGEFVIVSNFTSGSICIYRICQDGTLMETDFIRHKGASVHAVRQKGPHAHSCITVKGSNKIIIPDLGIDKLMVYELNKSGKAILCSREVYSCPPGSGPRFGVFHPILPIFYVINELTSSIAVLQVNDATGQFNCLQEVSTLPVLCENICADIHVTGDGRFVYASNRGHDSITAFEVNLKTGTLSWLFNVPCGGKTPRSFAVDFTGRFLLAGNQDSDELVLFEIEGRTGELTEVNRLEIPNPVCICQR